MSASSNIWQTRWGLWVPPLVILVAALVALGVYRGRFAEQAEGSVRSVEGATRVLSDLEERSGDLASNLDEIETTRNQLAAFFTDQLSTENERLTAIIAEVKTLAETAGLDPQAIGYPDEVIDDFGLRKRSIVFGVQGSYTQLRRLINLLELSDSFLTLEQVTLVGENQNRLAIDLKISTLFATDLPEVVEDVPVAPQGEAG
ncbi:MAG: hypothetical protein AAF481_18330 [Acidobacteriota bacterium]